MLVFPELIVGKVIADGINALTVDSAPITEMLRFRPEKEIVDLQKYLQMQGSTDLKVKRGYPRSTPSIPGIWVSLGDSAESEQTIGSDYPDDLTPELLANEENLFPETLPVSIGTRFRTMVRIAIRTGNADYTPLLTGIVTTILLANRLAMETQGMMSQSLSMMDLMPDPRMEPDLIFQRDIRLSCEHAATVVSIVRTITDVDLTVTSRDPSIEETIAVVRNRKRAA